MASLCHGLGKPAAECDESAKPTTKKPSSHFTVGQPHLSIFVWKQSDILYDLPSMSSLGSADLTCLKLEVHEHPTGSSTTVTYLVRTLSVARTLEAYLLLAIRDKGLGMAGSWTWLSIACYFPLYLDRTNTLIEKIHNLEAREMYAKLSNPSANKARHSGKDDNEAGKTSPSVSVAELG